MDSIIFLNIFVFVSIFLMFFLVMGHCSKKKGEDGDFFFYLDENDGGHIKRFPKGADVDGVKLTDEDLRTLRETGKLDISERKNFKSKRDGKKFPTDCYQK